MEASMETEQKEPSYQSAAVIEDAEIPNKNLNHSINNPNEVGDIQYMEEDIIDDDDEKVVPLIRPLTINRG
eukprot:CAMPEP_0205822750 /NCGR_PEP_ID=MMETSP0206-20130828/13852_1 /ASSEMBLY_ACC=CAM_ASM_000279 /TAXON_ID=36767 /ORGANISM="Euplotes focardii, Strain TN1" /LENGTH=70 /DNA_ID=CAMNT_0053119281 /DNA_START=542 /DNA_END=750 /DNA_ORIENTATION=+